MNLSALACLVPTGVALLFTAVVFGRYFDRGLGAHLLETFSVRNLLAPAKPLVHPAYLREGYEAYFAELRDSTPLPPIQGTVDTYPGNASALFAWGCDYHPRPIMQSLVAYAPELEELNAAFLGRAKGREARVPAGRAPGAGQHPLPACAHR